MFELLLHTETITHSNLSLKDNDSHFLNNITHLTINNLFQFTFIIREVAYEVN
jgi:hypothetical protein